MEEVNNDNDLSWLTQVPSIESQKATFEVVHSNDGSDEGFFASLFGTEVSKGDIVSLEDEVSYDRRQIL